MRITLIIFFSLMLLAVASIVIFGKDRYRYPCQDPLNWKSEDCQFEKQFCIATGTCTEFTLKSKCR